MLEIQGFDRAVGAAQTSSAASLVYHSVPVGSLPYDPAIGFLEFIILATYEHWYPFNYKRKKSLQDNSTNGSGYLSARKLFDPIDPSTET